MRAQRDVPAAAPPVFLFAGPTLAASPVGRRLLRGSGVRVRPPVARGDVERLVERFAALEDAAFIQRLPALREGFDVLSPAARRRFLGALRPGLAPKFDLRLEKPASVLAQWAAADLHARQVLLSQLPHALEPLEGLGR